MVTFQEFWDSINPSSAKIVKEHFYSCAPKLTEQLILYILENDHFEIGLSWNYSERWSHISYDQWDTDKILSLRFSLKEEFDLFFSFYTDDGYQEISYPLNQEEIEMVPQGLRVLMQQVVISKEAKAVSKNTLRQSH